VSHFSPVPPEERAYAKNYRQELQPLEAQLVEVSGRVKEFRDHPERSDLQSLLLVNLTVRPLPRGKIVKLSHLWVLTKHVVRTGAEPKQGRRVKFNGSVYAYFRLGGKSKERGLHGSHDFSILPMGPTELETFTPGLEQRYANNDEIKVKSPNRGRNYKSKGGSNPVGKGAPSRCKPHADNRHGDNGHPEPGPID